jgi:hypothetical protein
VHRRVALLLLWVGLLGTALPALACPAGTSACCRAQDSSSCSGSAGVVGITAPAVCCSSAPVPAYVLSIGPTDPRARASLHASGSPDALGEDRWTGFPPDFTPAGVPSIFRGNQTSDMREITMSRFTHTATKLGAAAVLVGSYVLTSAAFAAGPVHPPLRGVRIWKVRWHAHTEGMLLAREAGGVTMGRSIVAAGAFRLPCLAIGGKSLLRMAGLNTHAQA